MISNLNTCDKKSDFNIDIWISNCFSKLNDDFNTPMLIAELFECVKFINNVNINSKSLNSKDKDKLSNAFSDILFNILGFKKENIESKDISSSAELIKLLIKLRNQSRANRNFELSDQIRDDLMELGIQLNDDKNESSFKIIK
jgi:cysteinyl-tRNA synthetase